MMHMKVKFPACFFQHNKLKEIFYKSYIVKNSQDKFAGDFQSRFPGMETVEEILMMNIRWGSSKKTVTRLLGNPRFANRPVADPAKEILFFKQQIAEEKAIVQCHFIKDQFYYGHVDFVSSLSRENKTVQEMVREKFKLAERDGLSSMIITDPASNKLVIEHNVYLQLHYITGKPALVRKINDLSIKSEIRERDKLVLRHSLNSSSI
jgi:hypothetical protein